MNLTDELLAHARHLVEMESERPSQASLRRGVSAAYYGLFHLVTGDAANAMVGGRESEALRALIRRAFQHRAMKGFADGFRTGNIDRRWKLFFDPPLQEITEVAKSLCDLHETRERADYDVSRDFTKLDALDFVEEAEHAAAVWTRIRDSGDPTTEGQVQAFLIALLLHGTLPRMPNVLARGR